MKVNCILCEREVETKNEDVFMTVRWCFVEMLKLNDIKVDRDVGRVVEICSKCWTDKLKNKPSMQDYWWVYNKEI